MNLFKKDSEPLIEFISWYPYLLDIPEVQPQPSNKFIPEWWRTTPYVLDKEKEKYKADSGLVKQCPAFPDLFSSGYILPMWADTTLYHNSKTGEWKWNCGNFGGPFKIDVFENHRFKDYANYHFNGFPGNLFFQFHNPWIIKCPKGYSIFQLPLFYHDNKDYSVLPGTFDGYASEQGKLEVVLFADNKEIFIKRGTPLVQYILYKKPKSKLSVRTITKEDRENFDRKVFIKQTQFKNWYAQNRDRGLE